jgi:hypothetical protein
MPLDSVLWYGIYIGGGNLVKSTPAEWNILVQAIKTGELTEL